MEANLALDAPPDCLVQQAPHDSASQGNLFRQSSAGSAFAPPGSPGLCCQMSLDSDEDPFLSRQSSVDAPPAAAEGHFLPRDQPFVGFMRHAPQLALYGQLDRLLRRRGPRQAGEAVDSSEPAADLDSPTAQKPPVLPRASPYVGFQRHAPPSPMLRFAGFAASPLLMPLELPAARPLGLAGFSLEPARDEPPQWPGRLPEEVWVMVLSAAMEASSIRRLSCVSRGFPELVQEPGVWAGQAVRLAPAALPRLAPCLGRWLNAWRRAERLVVPRSAQLLAEVARRAPELPVEVAWRFDQHLKGDGVDVLRHGMTARRNSEDELVVLGDAPLTSSPGRPAFMEFRLDERGEAVGDCLNDFGFGVTATEPEDIRELGSVADEVPRSWVVDFTQSSVVLSVNNHEAVKGRHVSAADLHQGDRVGLRFMAETVEVYINGVLCERLVPQEEDRVPVEQGLYPVIDLYGRTVQISRTEAEGPLP